MSANRWLGDGQGERKFIHMVLRHKTLFVCRSRLSLRNSIELQVFAHSIVPAAQHCVGTDGTEAIGESSSLSAAAQLHR